jgi:hypothetical protein
VPKTIRAQGAAGRCCRNPLPTELLKEKFVNCALRVLPESNVAQLYAAIDAFEQLQDVREATQLAAPPRPAAARAAAAARA